MYGERSLPPALEHFCEGKLPTIAEKENKQIMCALFVPSIQCMKLWEVEDLARQPESSWRRMFLRQSPAAAVSNLKGTGVTLPREVAATIRELTEVAREHLVDMDVDAFLKDISSLQVGE